MSKEFNVVDPGSYIVAHGSVPCAIQHEMHWPKYRYEIVRIWDDTSSYSDNGRVVSAQWIDGGFVCLVEYEEVDNV